MLSREAPQRRRSAEPAARPLIRAALTLALAAVALAIAACGSEGSQSTTSAVAASQLAVTLDVDGEGGRPQRSADVGCAPGDDSASCSALAALTPADFAPTRPTQACTEIFGGPDVATVSGTLSGEPVSATFTRANGCEIERFDAIAPLLQAVFAGYEPGAAIGA